MLNFSKKHFWQFLTISMALSILIGCGFKLRGNYSFPKELQQVYITPNTPFEPFQKNLRRQLLKNGVQVLSSPTDDVAILFISAPSFSEEVLATNITSQMQRLKVNFTLDYRLTKHEKDLLNNNHLKLSKDYLHNPNQPVTGSRELQIIQDELINDGVQQLLRQLSNVKN